MFLYICGAGTSARPKGGLRAEDTGCPGPKPATERSDRRGAETPIIGLVYRNKITHISRYGGAHEVKGL